MGGVYETYVANVDKGQWHVVTLVWSFKSSAVSVTIFQVWGVKFKKKKHEFKCKFLTVKTLWTVSAEIFYMSFSGRVILVYVSDFAGVRGFLSYPIGL